MGRRVVLSFTSRPERILPGTFGRFAQLSVPYPTRESAVGHALPLLGGEHLLHTHRVAARSLKERLKLLAMRRLRRCSPFGGLLGTAQDTSHRVTRELQQAADLAQWPTLGGQRAYHTADFGRDHGSLPAAVPLARPAVPRSHSGSSR